MPCKKSRCNPSKQGTSKKHKTNPQTKNRTKTQNPARMHPDRWNGETPRPYPALIPHRNRITQSIFLPRCQDGIRSRQFQCCPTVNGSHEDPLVPMKEVGQLHSQSFTAALVHPYLVCHTWATLLLLPANPSPWCCVSILKMNKMVCQCQKRGRVSIPIPLLLLFPFAMHLPVVTPTVLSWRNRCVPNFGRKRRSKRYSLLRWVTFCEKRRARKLFCGAYPAHRSAFSLRRSLHEEHLWAWNLQIQNVHAITPEWMSAHRWIKINPVAIRMLTSTQMVTQFPGFPMHNTVFGGEDMKGAIRGVPLTKLSVVRRTSMSRDPCSLGMLRSRAGGNAIPPRTPAASMWGILHNRWRRHSLFFLAHPVRARGSDGHQNVL